MKPDPPMQIDEDKLAEIIELLKKDILSLREVAEKSGINPMYLSGFLHGLHLLGILEKKVKGATHIYRVKNEKILDDLL